MREKIAALSLAGCLLLAGCRGGETPAPPSPSPSPSPTATALVPQEVRPFALPVDPAGGWDPYVGSRSGNMTLAPLLYEGLFALDGSFEYHSLLAREASASEDGLTWTVKLREGVFFSNGQALDAQTAAAAVRAAQGEKSVYAPRLAGVRAVEAQEDALVFTLSAPNARFPALLDFPIALVTEEEVYGTGPYVAGEDKLTANPGWWRGLELPLEEMELLEVADADALVAAFNAGELSLAADDPTGSGALGYAGNYQSWEYATSQMLYLGFQCAKGPCRDPVFRRAVSGAIDRQGLVNTALSGHGEAAALPVHPVSALYDDQAARRLDWDPQAAARALDELGYTLGEDGRRHKGRTSLSLTLLVNADSAVKAAAARSIAQTLEELGAAVEVRTLAWEEYKKALEKGEFDLYLAEYRMTGDMDPSPLLTPGSGLCYGGFQSQELAQALAQAKLTGEWAEFQRLWAEESPLAVLCFKTAQLLTQWGQVTGAEPTQGNLFYHLENWRVAP